MGPSPSESLLKKDIIAATKRSLEPTDNVHSSPQKKRNSLTTKSSQHNSPSTALDDPSLSTSQSLATINKSKISDVFSHDVPMDMAVDHHSQGEEFKTSTSPKEISSLVDPILLSDEDSEVQTL